MERSEQDVERRIGDMHLINKLKRGEREREKYIEMDQSVEP